MSKKLTIATCQHAVSADLDANFSVIDKQIEFAKSKGADIVHFSECNLSGYAGTDFEDITTCDPEMLDGYLDGIQQMAKVERIWIIVGSHHCDKKQTKPHISLYVINNKGEIVDRYDKRHLYGNEGENDNKHYSPGIQPVVFEINGIKCGLLICHEWRYSEFFREYCKLGVQLLFHSFYDAKLSSTDYLMEGKDEGELIMGGMRAYAANNNFWISISNSSEKESCFPGCIIQPDGQVFNRLVRNRPGVIISELDFDKKFRDPSKRWRVKLLK